MSDLKDKTLFITGASRGIGRAIALRAARDGARIVIAAKTDRPHPKLPGTIHTVADEVEQAGGRALPLKVDIRHESAVADAAAQAADTFGGLDILVNNASAIWLADTANIPMKRYDLMHQVNARGAFVCSQACYPYLKDADNPHILMLSPPPDIKQEWLKPHLAYTLSKFNMSLIAWGLSAEWRDDGIAVNALWPRTVIATAALAMLGGAVKPENCRKEAIVADAAHAVLTRDAAKHTGQFYIDENVLEEAGVTDFDAYAVDPEQPLYPDLFL